MTQSIHLYRTRSHEQLREFVPNGPGTENPDSDMALFREKGRDAHLALTQVLSGLQGLRNSEGAMVQ